MRLTAERADPAPFDIATIKPPHGQMDGSGKFSPNLYRWMKDRWASRFSGHGLEQHPSVFRGNAGVLWIGHRDEGGWFHGTRLIQVCSFGTAAQIFAYAPPQTRSFHELKGFWDRYRKIGRCAIDPSHDRWWADNEGRWAVKGNTRHCTWCGKHRQRKRVRTIVKRERVERWEPRP